MTGSIKKYPLYYYLPFLLLIVYCIYTRIRLLTSYSVDLAGLEYYFVRLTQQLQQGQPLYLNPELYPYSNCLYTPVYFYLYSAVLHLLNLDIRNDLHAIFIAGRLLSLFFVFIQLFILSKLIKRFSGSFFHLLLAITLYLLLITSHIYAVRPDALKLLFFTAFIYYLSEYLFFSSKRSDAVACIAAAVLAVYTKQDISVPITLCLLIPVFFLRNKRSLLLLLSFLSCSLLVLLSCFLIFGKSLFANLILFNIQTVTDLSHSYNIYFFLLSLLRTFPLLLLALFNYRRSGSVNLPFHADKFIIYTTLLLYPIAHLSFFRAGANLNYTYELLVFLILNIPLFFRYYSKEVTAGKYKAAGLTGLYLFVLLLSNAAIRNYSFHADEEALHKKEYYDILRDRKEISEIVGSDTLFFPNTQYSVFFIDQHVVLGHDMHLDRFINLYTSIYLRSELKFINTSGYDRNFENGKIRYIVTKDDAKSREHVSHYYPSYSPYKSTGNMLIYRFGHIH